MIKNKSNVYDVIVIGAGLAGSSAAYELANAGVKVLVLEKEKLPRYKTCGGGVVHRAVKLLPFSIDEVIERKFFSVDVYDYEQKLHFIAKGKEPIINMTMRSTLDQFILSKAIDKGADIFDETEVKSLDNTGEKVEVFTNETSFSSEYVIAADGVNGVAARSLSFRNSKLRIPAVEIEMFVKDNVFGELGKSTRFDFGIVPHGYSWVFPKKEHLSIGIAIMKNKVNSMQAVLNSYLDYVGISKDDIIKESKHGFIIPLMPRSENFVIGRVLFAGDAAGLADPITAEGISYAIESGQLAARAILDTNQNNGILEKVYNQMLSRIVDELKSAGFLSHFVYSSNALRKFIFKHYGKRLSQLVADIALGMESYTHLVHSPPNYLKLLRPSYFIGRTRN